MSLPGKRTNDIHSLEALAESLKSTTDTNLYGAMFIELIGWLRPRRKEEPGQKMEQLLALAQQDKSFREALRNVFMYLFNTRDCQSLFTNVGILTGGTFFKEMLQQVSHRLIPPLPEKRSMTYLLERAFYKKKDYEWVQAIPREMWIDFFQQVAGDLDDQQTPLQQYLINALTVLSYRVSSLGLETELNQRQDHYTDGFVTPFIEQNKKVQSFIHILRTGEGIQELIDASAEQILAELISCMSIIDTIKKSTVKHGTSLGQSYVLLRTEQQVRRMRIIIEFLTGTVPQKTMENSVDLFEEIIESINKRNSISDLYKKNSGMLAYQIAEHKSASGEHYITTTKSEYTAFFYSAAAGGFIIAFAAVMKAVLHHAHAAPFWQYFLYGLNYAVAFVLLFVTGASLATKQPAMTASALASSLDARKGSSSLEGLAITFAKVWRSQFASFAGNLIVVFPLSYILAVLWQELTGTLLLETRAESLQALHDQNPMLSGAWIYACITGVCLFISGIITGFVDNKVIYGNIGARIKEHAFLRRFISAGRLSRIGDYISHNLGGIVGNVSLGFMLGYAKLIGEFFGIPFDIRHITISTAYFAFGVEGLDNNIALADWVWTTIGVIGIGFFNFLISFSLAFYVAIRSRNVPLSRLPFVGKLIWRYFVAHPKDFVYPPAEERSPTDVFRVPPIAS